MEENTINKERNSNVIPASILIAAAIIGGAILLRSDGSEENAAMSRREPERGTVSSRAVPARITLPIRWGDLGQRMVSVGVLDREKFLSLYSGTEREEARRFIDETRGEPLVVSEKNAGILLNLLWGMGIGNKSAILEKGEMTDPRFGGAGQFASTGGWTIADGDPMNHYSRHPFVVLTAEQEGLVSRVSQGIFRPCCNNSTHFPDCNHGMAMLGLLELMAAEGASETEMYDAALVLNRLWFPAQYEAIDRYAAQRGETAGAKTLLSAAYSSASGFQRVVGELEKTPQQAPQGPGGGGGCSV